MSILAVHEPQGNFAIDLGTSYAYVPIPGLYVEFTPTADPIVVHFQSSFINVTDTSTSPYVGFELFDVAGATPYAEPGGESVIVNWTPDDNYLSARSINHNWGPFVTPGGATPGTRHYQVFATGSPGTVLRIYNGAVPYTNLRGRTRLWVESFPSPATPLFYSTVYVADRSQ